MFLLNSRFPLVTATCSPFPIALLSKTLGSRPQAPLLPKLRGQFAEFPRPGSPRHALGFSPRGTCVGSRYGRGGFLPASFSRAPGIGRTALTGGYSRLRLVLAITALPRLRTVKRGGSPARPTPRRQALGLRRRRYLRGTGILTGFPFG